MSACARSGCQGTVGSHGYCEECGHKARTADPSPPPRQTAPERSQRSSQRSAPRRSAVSIPVPVGGGTTGRGRVGNGLVELPPLPPRDPATDTSVVVEVPETKRFCRECHEPVGRGVNGEPGPTEGVCEKDGTRFAFTPALGRGERVADRYEIARCIARGGQGWIYLARDLHLSDSAADHWVVLKGLIDTDDPIAVSQAVEERRHLLRVKHQNIVRINDFAQHPDPRTGRLAGYIVMEYIEGRSLQELFREHRDATGRRAPLPLKYVLAYGLDVLQALGHLHSEGLLYCDFKPENVLYTGSELKLIDLGAVVRADKPGDVLMATRGFAAPELGKHGPSVASDLHTVGRALAVLSIDFAGFTTDYQYRLPERDSVPLFAEHESFYRLLSRATHADPAQRFSSADEMRGQLEGVLFEVLAAEDGRPRPTVSAQFTVERRTFGTDIGAESTQDGADEVDWTQVPDALPAPLVDPKDEAAAYLAAIAATDPDDVIDSLLAIPVRSHEVRLQLIGARITNGHLDDAKRDLDDCAAAVPGDWRVAWYRGICAMAGGQPKEAQREFNAVYDALPGELTPKLALAAAAESDGRDERAGELYERVWRTDSRYVSAAFGLARILRRRGDLAAAVAALDGVPDSSSQHMLAQVAAIRVRLAPGLAKPELLDAAARLERLRMGIERQAELSVKILSAALDWVIGSGEHDRSGTVLGRALEERQLRFGLEKAYRDLATVTDDTHRKVALVRQANRARPRTLF